MGDTSFLTLVYPETVHTADGNVVRLFAWCHFLRRTPDSSGSVVAFERAFIEQHRPYSIIPHAFAMRNDLRLSPIPHETITPPQAPSLGLGNATAQTAVLRFVQDHTTPSCPDEERTCPVVMWCQAEGAKPEWVHPVLGGDFLLEHRMRLFVDYHRLEYAPTGVGRVRYNSLVPCGYLEYPGTNGEPPNDGDSDDPFAGFPRSLQPVEK